MGFIKFEPISKPMVCRHPGHNPPGMIVLPEGTHTWQCPGCGQTTSFIVSRPTMSHEVSKVSVDYSTMWCERERKLAELHQMELATD